MYQTEKINSASDSVSRFVRTNLLVFCMLWFNSKEWTHSLNSTESLKQTDLKEGFVCEFNQRRIICLCYFISVNVISRSKNVFCMVLVVVTEWLDSRLLLLFSVTLIIEGKSRWENVLPHGHTQVSSGQSGRKRMFQTQKRINDERGSRKWAGNGLVFHSLWESFTGSRNVVHCFRTSHHSIFRCFPVCFASFL